MEKDVEVKVFLGDGTYYKLRPPIMQPGEVIIYSANGDYIKANTSNGKLEILDITPGALAEIIEFLRS